MTSFPQAPSFLDSSTSSICWTARLYGEFLDSDVQQAKRVQSSFPVGFEFVVEAVWFPSFGEEDEGDAFSVSVELQSTSTHAGEDVRIVHHAHFHTPLSCSELQVAVGGGTERIAHHEERHVFGFCGSQQVFFDALLGEFPICHFDFHAVRGFQFLHARRQDAGVRLQHHPPTSSHGLQPSQCDVGGVSKSQTHQVEHYGRFQCLSSMPMASATDTQSASSEDHTCMPVGRADPCCRPGSPSFLDGKGPVSNGSILKGVSWG
eukprot:scaffold519_cov331-Pavlova_lutheri.AAC.8